MVNRQNRKRERYLTNPYQTFLKAGLGIYAIHPLLVFICRLRLFSRISFIAIASPLCRHWAASAPPQRRLNVATAPPSRRHCAAFTPALRRLYAGTAPSLRRHRATITTAPGPHFVGTMPPLRRRRVGSAPPSHRQCTGIASGP